MGPSSSKSPVTIRSNCSLDIWFCKKLVFRKISVVCNKKLLHCWFIFCVQQCSRTKGQYWHSLGQVQLSGTCGRLSVFFRWSYLRFGALQLRSMTRKRWFAAFPILYIRLLETLSVQRLIILLWHIFCSWFSGLLVWDCFSGI